MLQRIVALIFISGLTACAAAPSPPTAPPPPSPPPVSAAPPPPASRPIAVTRLPCDNLLSAAEDDRAAASMFYLGYAAARTHIAVVDVNQVEDIEKHALDYCLAHPTTPAWIAYRIALTSARH